LLNARVDFRQVTWDSQTAILADTNAKNEQGERMKMLPIALLLAAGLFAPGAIASTAPLELNQIRAQQQEIRADLIAGKGRYKDMSATTKTELLSRQDQLLKMIGDKHDPDELTKDQRLQAFNTLEWIEATINKSADERMICTRERATGSQRVTTVCKTQRQIKEAHERARRQTDGNMPMDI
jgi:hypothetical protein